MKLFLVIASAVLLASSAVGKNSMDSRMRSRRLDAYTYGNSALTDSNQGKLTIEVPKWVDEWFPKIDQLLWEPIKKFEEDPALVSARPIDLICDILTYTGLLKPSYVPTENQLTLALYANRLVSEYVLTDVARLVNDPIFNKQKNVTIFISGWQQEDEHSPTNVVNALGTTYVSRGQHNFIRVNLGEFIGNVYQWATLDSKQTGELIGKAVAHIVKSVPAEKVHLIGHGVGAHVAGLVGRYVSRETGQQIARITALDPSRICHVEQFGAYSLQRGDAAFVDVIHTSLGGFGYKAATGDVDFYSTEDGELPKNCRDYICAQNRAVEYYTESVKRGSERNFMAMLCTSLKDLQSGKCYSRKVPMGLNTPSDVRGRYYVETNSRPPYGKGDDGDSDDY